MDTSRLVYGGFFLIQLLILQGIHHLSGAREVLDHDRWSKTSVGNVNMQMHEYYPDGNIVLISSENDEDDPNDHDFKASDDDQNDGSQQLNEMHSHSSSHMMMNHMDPSTIVFFQFDDLKLGKKLPIFFPDRDLPSPSSPNSLAKSQADSIPFSLKQLPDLLQLFSFSQESPQAIAMENTLRECETSPIKGETKLCATSYESMFNFATQILGPETNIKLHSTVYLARPSDGVHEYTIIEDPLRISGPKMVACHTMPYPYTVFYCHYQKSKNRVYKVSLKGENGNRVKAIAVCHMDTSQWNPNHISFRVLGSRPGSSPVCHFFPADNFVLVPLPSA